MRTTGEWILFWVIFVLARVLFKKKKKEAKK